MHKYALVLNGKVQSVFYSDKSKSEFPDIADNLHVVGEEIDCNWHYHKGHFYKPPEPVEIRDESGNIDWVVPQIKYTQKNITKAEWALAAGSAGAATAAALALGHFLKAFG